MESGKHGRLHDAARRSGGEASCGEGSRNGLFYGVSCGEWLPYETEQSVAAAGRRAFPVPPVSNSVVVTIPNIAHVAFGSPSASANACAYAITRSFFEVLTKADTSCVRKVPPTKFEL